MEDEGIPLYTEQDRRKKHTFKDFQDLMLPWIDKQIEMNRVNELRRVADEEAKERIDEQKALPADERGRAPYPPDHPTVLINQEISNENFKSLAHHGIDEWNAPLDITTGEHVKNFPERTDLKHIDCKCPVMVPVASADPKGDEASRILKSIGVSEEKETAEEMHHLIRLWVTWGIYPKSEARPSESPPHQRW